MRIKCDDKNNRLCSLYDLLLEHPNEWLSQEYICACLPEYYQYHMRDNDRCSTIRDDMNEINANEKFEKIIVCKKYKFKIASEEEYKHNRNMHLKRLIEQVRIIRSMDIKACRNKQGYMTLPDDIEKELRYYETFD